MAMKSHKWGLRTQDDRCLVKTWFLWLPESVDRSPFFLLRLNIVKDW